MPQYRVRLIRTQEYTITVNAGNEDDALDMAQKKAPEMSARESGWGQEWAIDSSEWQNVEDFYYPDHSITEHGETVEALED